MRGSLFGRIFISLMFAASVTAGAFWWDGVRSEVHETNAALRWARQIVTQAEGMSLAARERGEKDPLGFAVDYLSQGAEPRMVRMTRVTPETAPDKSEVYQLNRMAGVFDYTRLFEHTDGDGIHLQIEVGFSGFLGTRTKINSDLALAIFFIGSFFVLLSTVTLIFRALSGKTTEEAALEKELASPTLEESLAAARSRATAASEEDAKETRLRISVLGWAKESKTSLTTLGTNIRDLIRQAQVMSAASKGSRETTGALRDKLHAGLTEVHSARGSLKDTLALVEEAEAIFHNPMTEESAEQLHSLILRMQEAFQAGERAVHQLEVSIEPWTTDADMAYAAHDGVTQATVEMAAQIQKTKEQMVSHVKLLQEFTEQLQNGERPKRQRKSRKTAESAQAA